MPLRECPSQPGSNPFSDLGRAGKVLFNFSLELGPALHALFPKLASVCGLPEDPTDSGPGGKQIWE